MNRLISAVVRVESVLVELPVARVGNRWSITMKNIPQKSTFPTCVSLQLWMKDVVDLQIALRLFSRLFRPIAGDEIISAGILQKLSTSRKRTLISLTEFSPIRFNGTAANCPVPPLCIISTSYELGMCLKVSFSVHSFVTKSLQQIAEECFCLIDNLCELFRTMRHFQHANAGVLILAEFHLSFVHDLQEEN